MELAALMEQILSHACPSHHLDDDYWQYTIDTHCVRFTIEAKAGRQVLTEAGDYDRTSFTVRNYTVESI